MPNNKPMTEKEALAHLKLLLAIQQPDVEQCWLEGYEQSQRGMLETGNPYPLKSIEHSYWNDGWWAATAGEDALFTSSKGKFFQPTASHSKKGGPNNTPHPMFATALNATAAKVSEWPQMIAFRVIELIIATIIAVAGYQIVEFAFV